MKLSELCREDRTIIDPESEQAKQLPYLSLEHIESNTGRLLVEPSELALDEGQSTTFAFNPRHILYGKLRPYLNKVALPTFSGRCTTEFIPLLPCPNVSRRYLGWLLRRPETVAFAMQGKTGSRMPRANIKELLTLPVPIPKDIETQERLADEIDVEMMKIKKAKEALQEQLALIEELSQRILIDFPLQVLASEGDS